MVRVKVGFNLPLSKFSDPPPQTTPRLESAPHISELAGESHKVAALSQRQTSVCICRKRYNEMWSRLPEARERRGGKCRRTKDSEEGERVTVAAESQRPAQCVASAALTSRRGVDRAFKVRLRARRAAPPSSSSLLLCSRPQWRCNALVVLQLKKGCPTKKKKKKQQP